MFLFVLNLIAFGLAAFALWYFFVSNPFTVEPRKRERLVIQNVLTGETQVLGVGTHYRSMFWKKLVAIETSREPIRVPAKKGDPGEEFRTFDNVRGLVDYRYDIVAGRKSDGTNGRVVNVDKIENDVVKRAATEVNYEQHREFVAEKVEAAIEVVLRDYLSDQLFCPSTNPVNGHILKEISEKVQSTVDLALKDDAFNVVEFQISNIKPASEKMNDALEKRVAARHIVEGAQAVRQASGNSPLSIQEALVVDNPDALAQIVKAKALERGAQALGKGLERIGIGVDSFGRGVKEVGRGMQKPGNTP